MVEIVDTAEGITALVPAWRALEARAAQPLLFLSPDWVLPWFEAFAGPGCARVAVLRDGTGLRALAPFVVTTRKFGPLPARTLALMHNAQSTRCDVLCAPDDPDAAGALLTGVLAQAGDYDVVELRDLRANSATMPALRQRVAALNARAEWLPSGMLTPVLPCVGTWADYFDTRSHNFRRNLARAWHKLEQRGTGDTECCRTPEEVREGVRILADIEAAGWKGAAGTALAANPRSLRFYTAVATRFAARGAVDLSLLRIDGAPVAACLAIRHRGVVYGLKVSYHPAFAEGSPGMALVLALLERQWTPDTVAFDFLQTSTFPAHRLTGQFEDRIILRIFTGGMYGRMLGALKVGYGRWRRPAPAAAGVA